MQSQHMIRVRAMWNCISNALGYSNAPYWLIRSIDDIQQDPRLSNQNKVDCVKSTLDEWMPRDREMNIKITLFWYLAQIDVSLRRFERENMLLVELSYE